MDVGPAAVRMYAHAGNVEPEPRSVEPVRPDERLGQRPELPLFGCGDRREAAAQPTRSSGLHLAEHHQIAPPDDQVELSGAEERDDGTIVARYAWLADEGREAGEMRLTPREGRIAKLVVTFD